MFALAILIGIYGYIIFSLGILGALTRGPVIASALIFTAGAYLYFKKHKEDLPLLDLRNKKIRSFLALFGVLAVVNLIGALGPELSFDALWYHLTIPKIFIEEQRIFYIEGGLFYYSLMPKLTEMLFIPGLMFGNDISAKLIQWVFGILTSIVVYKISRNFFDEKISIISSLIFYSSLLIAWESTVAYVDLARAFFDSMALWGLLNYLETKNRKWLIESSVMIGLAISVKFIAVTTIPIFFIILLFSIKDKKKAVKDSLIVLLTAILISSPWFIFSYLNSGNPFFPFFSAHFSELESGLFKLSLFNPIMFTKTIFSFFTQAPDPLTPVYIAFLPFLFIYRKKITAKLRPVVIYSILAILVWYPFAGVGGSRFLAGYLPALSVLSVALIVYVMDKRIKNYLISFVILICLITIGFRGIANSRYLPVVLGQESRSEFLTKNLNFNFGDFYDTDDWFANNIKEGDRVLLYGFHNLYYADFPFVHEGYARKGEGFNYIATQNTQLPERFMYWKLIYKNELTGVSVYTNDRKLWFY